MQNWREVMVNRWLWLLLLLCCTSWLKADQRIQGDCMVGNTTVNTAGQLSTNKVMGSFPSCTVTVFNSGFVTLASIYSDNARTPLSNPFTADSNGHYFFYLPSSNHVDVQLSGAGFVPSTFTLGDILSNDPTVDVTTICPVAFSATPTFTANSCGIVSMTLTGNVTSSTVTGGVTGQKTHFSLCQDGTGGRTFAWPASFLRPPTIASAINACTELNFWFDGTNWRQFSATGENLVVTGGATVGGSATISGALTAQSVGGVQYAANYAGSSTTCGITEAIAALPAAGGKVILQLGNCSASGWPVTVSKPVVIEGQGMGGPNDAGTNAAVVAGSSLTNTSTGNSFFIITLAAQSSLEGVTFRDFAMIGNKAIGGATAGDCVDINGGTTAQQVRAISFQNIQCNQPKGSGFVIKDNAFMINFLNVHVDQSGSHCYVLKDGVVAGVNSQIHFVQSTGDLCGGSLISSSPGTADGWNISGSTSRSIDITDSTLADSNNGVNVVVGATNTQIHVTNSDFETNSTCDVNLNDGYGHEIIGSTLFGTGVGARGVCTNMPGGANFANIQLLMFGNNIGGHLTQEITIGASQHTCFILPQAQNNYTFSDASATCVVLNVDSAGALNLTALGGLQPVTNGSQPLGASSKAWASVFTFSPHIVEFTAPAGAGGQDVCYGDSTAHGLKCSYNNGPFSQVMRYSDPTLTLKKGTGAGNYTSASTTYVVVDSTNLCLTVTIPTGFKLSVTVNAAIGTATGVAVASLALTDNASCATANAGILVETTETTTAAAVLQPVGLGWIITGDGAAHNVALQFKTAAGADSVTLANSSATLLPTMVFTMMPSN